MPNKPAMVEATMIEKAYNFGDELSDPVTMATFAAEQVAAARAEIGRDLSVALLYQPSDDQHSMRERIEVIIERLGGRDE